jgi:hypothetical protein
MTPDILPLLAASLACFSVLAFFARHNKRTGWVKPQRLTYHRLTYKDLVELERGWKSFPAPLRIEAVPAPVLPQPASLNDRTNFTLQLANIQQSLASATPVKVAEPERTTA